MPQASQMGNAEMSDKILGQWLILNRSLSNYNMQAETGGKLRLFTHESQQSWPMLSQESENSRDWRKKSSVPVTGLLLIIKRGNMEPKMTVSQLQNSFWNERNLWGGITSLQE